MIPADVLAKLRRQECSVFGLDGDCIVYIGRTTANGYPVAYIDGYSRRVHRYIWELVRGDVPDTLVLDHLCQTKICCNPDHLEPVTAAENTRRAHNPPYRLKADTDYAGWQRFWAMAESASVAQ